MIGDSFVFDETFAGAKERDRHSKKLEELHRKTMDDVSLNYIKLNNSQINY